MEPEGSLPYTQKLTAGSYLSQMDSVSILPPQFFKPHIRNIPVDV
jgi:hypothetical protein